MERPSNNDGRGPSGRGVARLVTVLAAACLIAWAVTSFQFENRAVVFDTLGIGSAEAGEKTRSNLARLRLLTRCVGYIRSNYVAPPRVKPLSMLMGALKGAESLVPDLMVTPDSDEPELTRSVVVRVGDRQRRFQLSGITDLYEMNWKLLDLFEYIATHLPSDVKADEVEYAAINGLLAPLDEHSVYLPPRAYKEMKLDTEGRFGGLGIVITTRKGLVTVVSVLPDTPAAKAGLKSRDQIVEIDDESTVNMRLNDAVSKLRGVPGTTVNILVQRKGWAEPRPFTVQRAEIRIQSVSSEVLGKGTGYVRIRHFQENTKAELEKHLLELRQKKSLDRLVLDLRQNPGGLLEQSVEVGDLFVKEGTLVITEGEGRRMRQEYRADGEAPFANLPMVVLIDMGTASASEIVAAAIKRNDRAILVGDGTFGKGTVQVMYEVGEGALKLTVAQYLTPGAISIQGVGIVPDVDLVPVSLDRENPYLGTQDLRRDHDPKRELEPFGTLADEKPIARLPVLIEVPAETEDEDEDGEEGPPIREDKFERDETIRLAEDIVRGLVSPTRSKALKEAGDVLAGLIARQDRRIVEGLKGHGIDWTAGAARPEAGVEVRWELEGKQPVLAGEKVKARVTAINKGSEPLFRLHCLSESDNVAFDGREFIFGRVDPGRSVTRELTIKVPGDSWDRVDQIRFHLFQGSTECPRPEPVTVATRSLPRPRFAYTWQVQDPKGNGDGLLNQGESVELVLDIRNLGEGAARKVLVTLRNHSGEGLYVRDGRVNHREGIPVDGAIQAKFRLDLRPGHPLEEVKVEVAVLDFVLREYMSEELVIPVYEPQTSAFDATERALRAMEGGVIVLSAADESSLPLFAVPEGFVFKSDARMGDLYRVHAGDDRFAFVPSSRVELAGAAQKASVPPGPPGLNHVEPALDLKFVGGGPFSTVGSEVTLTGTVRFAARPDDQKMRRKILVYRGNNKVFFWTRKGEGDEAQITVDTVVPLVKGMNDIAVYAIEGKGRSAVQRFTVFSESGKMEDDGVSVPSATAVPTDNTGGGP